MRNDEADMAQKPEDRGGDPKMDAASLYREEIITDRKVGTIRMLTPLKTTVSPKRFSSSSTRIWGSAMGGLHDSTPLAA